MITFSQGSVCLKKIPLSLRTLFRKTSVQLPDMETLLCGILRWPFLQSANTLSLSQGEISEETSHNVKKPCPVCDQHLQVAYEPRSQQSKHL